MNIYPNYQMRSFESNMRARKQSLQTNPNFGNKPIIRAAKETILPLAAAATILPLGVLATQNKGHKSVPTIYGPVEYTPSNGTEKGKLIVSRPNGKTFDVFENIPQAELESPVGKYVHQIDCSTINPKVGIVITQNESKPVIARKVVLEGTLENSLATNNMNSIALKHDKNMYTDTPWFPGRQDITQNCLEVTYGTVKEDWGALPEYIKEYADPKTGEAPDRGTLAAQKGSEDRSFMPADIAGKQYEIVTESGERIPCNYEDMLPGVIYKISKKAGVELKMAVPSQEVVSSEGEKLPAGKLYMVDSDGHFYNGNPIKRIKSGEVNWNADMNDPAQAQIRNNIDESIKYEAEAKAAKKEANKLKANANKLRQQALKKSIQGSLKATQLNNEANRLISKAEKLKAQANELNAKAKEFTAMAEQGMTEWVKSAQNPEGVKFFI